MSGDQSARSRTRRPAARCSCTTSSGRYARPRPARAALRINGIALNANGRWIPTRSATPSTALVPQRKVGFPIPNAGLLLGFQGTKTARREGISSPFSDAGGCTSPQNSGSLRPHLQLAAVFSKRPGPEAARRGQPQIDAGVVGQVVRRVWAASLDEVGRRANESLVKIRPNPYSDHVLGDLFAEAHACVVPLGHNVGQAVVIDDLNSDIRVVRQEPRHSGRQDRV